MLEYRSREAANNLPQNALHQRELTEPHVRTIGCSHRFQDLPRSRCTEVASTCVPSTVCPPLCLLHLKGVTRKNTAHILYMRILRALVPAFPTSAACQTAAHPLLALFASPVRLFSNNPRLQHRLTISVTREYGAYIKTPGCCIIDSMARGASGRGRSRVLSIRNKSCGARGAKIGSAATVGLTQQRSRHKTHTSVNGGRGGGGAQSFSSNSSFDGDDDDEEDEDEDGDEMDLENDDCEWMSVVDLKRVLRTKHLKVSGRKRDLIDRLLASRRKGQEMRFFLYKCICSLKRWSLPLVWLLSP